MSEYLRVFIGATELTYSTIEINESDDYIIDSAKIAVKGVTDVIPGAVVDITKADGTTSVFAGRVNSIDKSTTWTINILGNGYELNNLLIQTVWENMSPEEIIEDVVDTYTVNLTYSGTSSSGVTITKYIGNAYAIDIIKDMLDVLDWSMTIDSNDNVDVFPKETINNGAVFTNGDNVNLSNWKEDNNNLINRVAIIGGFESFNLTETVAGTGTTFSLSKKPQGSMRATVSGTVIDPSLYTVNADDKEIVFTSSRTNPVFTYSYSRPVIAEDQDDDSINTYGEIYKRIPAPWLTTTSEARKYAAGVIEASSEPLKSVKAIRGGINYDVALGETVRVIDNVRGQNLLMVVQSITKTGQGSTIYTLGSETMFFNEWQREVQERIKKIERRFSNQEDIVFSKRLKHNMKVNLTPVTTWEQASPQDTFWLNHATLGQLGTVVNGHIENFEADCSNNSNYGTWYGTGIDGSQFLSSGKRLSCGSFNGISRYVVAQSNLGDLSGAGSICAWVNTNSTTQRIIAANIFGANSKLILGINSATFIGTRYDGSTNAVSSSALTTNTWYHVAFTSDGVTENIYINGVLDNAGTSTLSITATSNLFTVGRNENGSNYFNGELDEVMVFDKAISQSTIQDIIANNFYTNHSDYGNCLCWYSFDNPRLGIRMGTRTTI